MLSQVWCDREQFVNRGSLVVAFQRASRLRCRTIMKTDAISGAGQHYAKQGIRSCLVNPEALRLKCSINAFEQLGIGG